MRSICLESLLKKTLKAISNEQRSKRIHKKRKTTAIRFLVGSVGKYFKNNQNQFLLIFLIQFCASWISTFANIPILILDLGLQNSIITICKSILLVFSIDLISSSYYLVFGNYFCSAFIKIALYLYFRGIQLILLKFSFLFQISYLVVVSILILRLQNLISFMNIKNEKSFNTAFVCKIFHKLKLIDIKKKTKHKKIVKQEQEEFRSKIVKKHKLEEEKVERKSGGEEQEEEEEEGKKKNYLKNKEIDNKIQYEQNNLNDNIEENKVLKQNKIDNGNRLLKILTNKNNQVKLSSLCIIFLILLILIIIIVPFLYYYSYWYPYDLNENGHCDSNSFITIHNNDESHHINDDRNENNELIQITKCQGKITIEEREYFSKGKYTIRSRIKNARKIALDNNQGNDRRVVYVICSGYFGKVIEIYPLIPKLETQKLTKKQTIIDNNDQTFHPNILTLVFDGASRKSYLENLQKTKTMIQNLEKDHHLKSWSFDGYRTFSKASAKNQRPMFSGQSDKIRPDNGRWIWNFYKDKLNYITTVIDQTCKANDSVQNSFGFNIGKLKNEVSFDHRVIVPFCEKKWNPFANNKPHCLYGQYGHNIIFSNIKRIFNLKNYNKFSKFIISYFYESHETSQKVLKTIDDDLAQFIYKFYQTKESQYTIILLLSDHGIHYGANSHIHHKFPIFELIIPNETLDHMAGIDDHLSENLHTKFNVYDIYYTLKHFGIYPKQIEISRKFDSLLNFIPERSCRDTFMQDEYCVAWKK
ncbi:hypothetical protein M0813_16389 [Anaeramoeba flamelloides]|uniref:Sulfatase N-terminal domain-containing protein n=1 Tax=Anaeramoeba flamelloides TaxID=1746091 RepID=A0ABQ8YZR8_9EUKA|nr:hypothetical protein M0813_16389 [Anaeramoeba flamelloides]